MWPRLFAQMIEILPHATRLLPVANTYLATRREADPTHAAALASISEDLREEVDRVSASYTSVLSLLSEQKKQIIALQDAQEVAENHRVTQAKQLEWMTGDLNTLRIWFKFGAVVIVLLLGALIALTVQSFILIR